jgi:hypothetical protein
LSNQESRPLSYVVDSAYARMEDCHRVSQEDFVSSYVAGIETVVTENAASESCQEGFIPSYVAGDQEVDMASAVDDFQLHGSNSEPQLPSSHVVLNPGYMTRVGFIKVDLVSVYWMMSAMYSMFRLVVLVFRICRVSFHGILGQ